MDSIMRDWEQKGLINELTQGRDLAKQLQHLTIPSSSSSSSSSLESREALVQRILVSYERALSIATCTNNSATPAHDQNTLTTPPARAVDSPPSLTGSPRSEDSDREFKEPEQRDLYKRRKTMPRWTQHVRVSHGAALEGPLDDGFSWRKYGQKDILGARYPRGYYRCTHRNVQGCLATKQVQRRDEDPSIYEITYRGRHTCTQAASSQLQKPTPVAPENKERSTLLHQPQHDQSPELLQSFQRDLKVVTEDLEVHHHHQPYPPPPSFLQFPSPSSSRPAHQDNLFSIITNQVAGSPFISPAASGTSGFSLEASPAPGAAGDLHGNVTDHHHHQPDQMNHDDIISLSSVTSSAADSATVGYGFPFGSLEFDPNFSFDHPGFFS